MVNKVFATLYRVMYFKADIGLPSVLYAVISELNVLHYIVTNKIMNKMYAVQRFTKCNENSFVLLSQVGKCVNKIMIM